MPQMRSYTEATQLQSTDGFWIDRIGVGSMWIPAGFAIPTTLIWTGGMFYEGSSPPASSQYLMGWSLPVKAIFPDNNADALALGWGFHTETLPSSTFVMNIALNDVLAATLTVNTDGTYAYASSGGVTWTANIRDRITLIAPAAPDATMNNFFLTIAGTLTS